MAIGGVVAAVLLPQLRAAAESLMVDACRIVRVTGEPGPVDENGNREPAPTIVVYEGRCKVQTYEPYESTPESGQHVYSTQRYKLHVPVGAAVLVDDQAELLRATLDPRLVGRSYRVAGLLHKSMATANRLLVDEIVR